MPSGGGSIGSLYVHVPFCFHKCHYCDFYSLVDRDDRQPAYARRLRAELSAAGDRLAPVLETVFVGGGTPTLLRAELWDDILADLALRLGPETEVTVEANPETVDEDLPRRLVAGGVNRVSIGCQSFDPRHLAALERWHDPASVPRAVDRMRAAGIGAVSLDLIFGIPGQALTDWRRDLDRVLALAPDHLSCYGLTYEPGTALTARLEAGGVERVDEETEAAMYEHTQDRLAAAGYEQYEISNWARPGRRCRHNLVYWTDGTWWPLGPAAAGHAGGWRWRNVPRLGSWLAGDGLPAIVDAERRDGDHVAGEGFMLGLRLMDGIARDRCEALLSVGDRAPARRAAIDRAVAEELLTWRGERLRLTDRGMLLADRVIADLL